MMFDVLEKGGVVMYPLLACSVVSLTVILERGIFWLREDRRIDRTLVDQVLELTRLQKLEEIQAKTQGALDYVVKILVCGLVHRNFSLSKAMEMAALEEIKRMKKHLVILDTIITAAPLLGILGTVIGIIHSFDMLGQAGIQDPQAVTAGIAQALLTTAAGLLIAIFTLFPYNYFNAKTDKARIRIEKYATSMEIVHRGDQTK
jgi:biopolymer transport protein ExbB